MLYRSHVVRFSQYKTSQGSDTVTVLVQKDIC